MKCPFSLFKLKSVGLFISFHDYSISRSKTVEFCADLHKIYNYMLSNCRQDGHAHLLLCAKSKNKSCIDSIMKLRYA